MSTTNPPGDDEGHRRVDPIVGRRPIFGHKRAALQQECDALAQQVADLDQQLVDLTQRRRKLADQLDQHRRRLYRRLVDRGRSPAADGAAQLPALPDDVRFLWGRRLRSTCRAILSRLGTATLVELHAMLHRLGYGVASNTPVKALADALGYDHDAGRVERVHRGTYAFPRGVAMPTHLWRGGPRIGPLPTPEP